MILLRLHSADLQRLRFAYSPLLEVAQSLYLVHSAQLNEPHRGWFEAAHDAIGRLDTEALQALVPARGRIARLFFLGATNAATTMDDQLLQVAQYPPDRLKADLAEVWRDAPPPPAVARLVAAGTAGVNRLTEDLHRYWEAAIQPHWTQMRAVLDGDVAHRAAKMAQDGIPGMMAGLHPAVTMSQDTVVIKSAGYREHDLSGAGLLLIPSVFVWPWILVDPGPAYPPRLIYGARGIGTLWQSQPPANGDALASLLGRTRAAMLERLALPQSTTDLARKLGQSAPTVSAHLSILRRCGMVSSWPAGRRVLYQRTPLANSLIIASNPRQRATASAVTADVESLCWQ
jgi:DNA-binding transcriptional ArsR family regulator